MRAWCVRALTHDGESDCVDDRLAKSVVGAVALVDDVILLVR